MRARVIPTKGVCRKPQSTRSWLVSGTSHVFLVLAVTFFFGISGMYVFAVNERAVYGYDIRTLEKELNVLKKENAQLRLREAEGRSLSKVEAGSATLRMEKADPTGQLTVEKDGPVAYH